MVFVRQSGKSCQISLQLNSGGGGGGGGGGMGINIFGQNDQSHIKKKKCFKCEKSMF